MSQPLIPSNVCKEKFWQNYLNGSLVNQPKFSNYICAGDEDGGESVCHGDSGGPLVPVTRDGDTAVVIGIASFVNDKLGCGAKGYPAVFAYVPNFIHWIQPLMSQSP